MELPSSSVVMASLFSWKAAIVYGYVLWALFIHLRGRERHKFHKQLTDHSTLVAPYNALMYGFSAVPNQAVHRHQGIPRAGAVVGQLADASATRR